jgi:hypothetical protein
MKDPRPTPMLGVRSLRIVGCFVIRDGEDARQRGG